MKKYLVSTIFTIASATAFAACAHQSRDFWHGLTDANAAVRYEHYDSLRNTLDGLSYRKVAALFGPGRFEGRTTDGQRLLFAWKGSQPGYESGGLTIVFSQDGKVVSHYYVMP